MHVWLLLVGVVVACGCGCCMWVWLLHVGVVVACGPKLAEPACLNGYPQMP